MPAVLTVYESEDRTRQYWIILDHAVAFTLVQLGLLRHSTDDEHRFCWQLIENIRNENQHLDPSTLFKRIKASLLEHYGVHHLSRLPQIKHHWEIHH